MQTPIHRRWYSAIGRVSLGWAREVEYRMTRFKDWAPTGDRKRIARKVIAVFLRGQ